ncbi:ABC transporter substrate-binding protein [Aeromicrobium sp. UC242_57]|uniref:ABC transporter substrate-binding protein n=1 Tax=Aeromicrobium sp. UC242_57 TaxID=3374624 RepID=UPI0037AB039A
MKLHIRRLRTVTLPALAAVLILSACGGEGGGESKDNDDTFTYLAVLPISGPLAQAGGLPARTAFEVAVETVNAGGGIDGRTVKLDIVDSSGDATKAVANLQAYLAENDKPDAVFGGQYSFEALPMAPILTSSDVLSFTSAGTTELNDPDKFPYTFQVSAPVSRAIEVLADHIAGEGHRKVAYIAVDDESGHTSVDAFKSVAKHEGLSVIDAYIPANAVDATPALERLRSQNPDVLVLSAVGPAAATMLKSRASSGWDVPAIGEGTAFANANDLGKISGPADWEGVTVQMNNPTVENSNMTSTPAFADFKEAFLAKSKINTAMTTPVTIYQNLIMAKAAYEATDSDDVADLAKALESLDPDTIPGSIKDLWIGPEAIGYSPENHLTDRWGPEDYTFVPAQGLKDGMVSAP